MTVISYLHNTAIKSYTYGMLKAIHNSQIGQSRSLLLVTMTITKYDRNNEATTAKTRNF